MYSLDVNFLKDRVEQTQDKSSQFTKAGSNLKGWTPLYLGIAAAVGVQALAGVGWLFLQNQNTQLESKVQELDAQLSRLGLAEADIKKIQEQTSQVQSETQALATVFNQIKPWSATLQDLRDRIPRTVQIESIEQIAAASPAPAPAATNSNNANSSNQSGTVPAPATPISPGGIKITGIARSFSDVNDFLLTLKQSAFLQAGETKIVSAESAENPVQGAAAPSVKVKLPPVVKYTIESQLSNVPASEIIRELERKGTLGLVTRIRTLQQKGVIQP
ncbi:MAG TPA: fimbrial protein [Cyanobacteria bacterium UBA11049]|nr:fimbrial protein [Cyanobacteria bacterium UBA11049]